MVNNTIRSYRISLLLVVFLSLKVNVCAQNNGITPNYQGADSVVRTLVWSDEFGGFGPINSSKWFHQTQLPSSGSWYNGEIQHYTNRTDNSVVANGKLIITARKESFTDQGQTKSYTSARLNSKFAFTYGYVEIRAKLPNGVGTWPALWLLGKNINENGAYWQTQGYGSTPWPACGEIDIMEHWGSNPNYVQSALHTPSSHGATINHGGQTVTDVANEYHVYGMDWNADRIVFSVDGNTHYVYNPSVKDENTWPFDEDHYFLFNVAILPSISPNFTSGSMEVDYIRVYQDIPTQIRKIHKPLVLKSYPNPVTEELFLSLDMEIPYTFWVYNSEGKMILTVEKATHKSIDVSDLIPGLYFIVIDQNGTQKSTKFFKK